MKLISARASRAPAPEQDRKARAGNLRRALEIEDAERRAEIPVRLRLEVERARLADAAHFDVVGRARADRHARVRQVRQHHAARRCAAARRRRAGRSSCLICCARARLASWIGVVSSPWRFARAISSPEVFCSALQPFDLGNQPAARGLERRDLLERLVGIEAAVAQTRSRTSST